MKGKMAIDDCVAKGCYLWNLQNTCSQRLDIKKHIAVKTLEYLKLFTSKLEVPFRIFCSYVSLYPALFDYLAQTLPELVLLSS